MATIALTITTAALSLYRDCMSGANTGLISYVALGTDGTMPTSGDVALGAEVFRKAVTSFINGTNAGDVGVNMYFSAGDAVGVNIQEIGLFGGLSATAAPNSGILVARALYSHVKLNSESIQFTFTLSVTA